MKRSSTARAGTIGWLMLTGAASLPGCGGGDSEGDANDGGKGGSLAGGSAGSSGTAGSPTGGSAGTPASGGAASGGTSSGGTTSGGTAGASGGTAGSGGGTSQGCGTTVNVNLNPFGCGFAWGANGNNNNRASYLQFITGWIGYEPFPPNNRPNDCDGCGLVRDLAATDAIPVFYAYYIGYAATADGYGDCNTDNDDDLCTHGAQWIREHRQQILDFYSSYAERVYAANPNKPVVWLLDGDFMQYTEMSQTQPLSVADLGALADDITCAIKTNAPNAVVAVNHTPWNGNEETDDFFGALDLSIYDMVWTTGVGDNDGLINQGAGSNEYNSMTARYSYIHQTTGKTLFVDTSFGVSQQADSWSNNPASVLNDRIADGVIAANVTEPPTDYQSRIAGLAPALDSTCE